MRREKTGRAGKSAEERGSGRREGERETPLATEKFPSRERGALAREEREGKERGIISGKRERTLERGKTAREREE